MREHRSRKKYLTPEIRFYRLSFRAARLEVQYSESQQIMSFNLLYDLVSPMKQNPCSLVKDTLKLVLVYFVIEPHSLRNAPKTGSENEVLMRNLSTGLLFWPE